MELGGQRHAPAALPPGEEPPYRRLSDPHDRSGRVRKISPPAGLRSPDRPARSESPYQLSYPGRSIIIIKALLNIITLVIAIKKWIRSRAFLCDICVLYYWHCHWQHDSTIAVLDTCTAISYLTILVHCWQQWIYTYGKKNNSVTFSKYVPVCWIRYKFIYIFLLILKVTNFLFIYAPYIVIYEGWNFNSGNYLFTTDTK